MCIHTSWSCITCAVRYHSKQMSSDHFSHPWQTAAFEALLPLTDTPIMSCVWPLRH